MKHAETFLVAALCAALCAAVLLAGAGHAASGGSPALASDAAGTRIVAEDFEGDTFPPPGWRVADDQHPEPNFQWDRETCEVEAGVGGSAAAWALGGGASGSALTCGGVYTDPVDTSLIYGPIDTTRFRDGLRVSMRLWVDQPAAPPGWPEPFLACATHGPGDSDFSCYQTGVTRSGWESFAPLDFPLATGRTDNMFWMVYRDRIPEGGHVGVFVDNVVIEGLGDTGPATSAYLPYLGKPPARATAGAASHADGSLRPSRMDAGVGPAAGAWGQPR